MRNNPTKLIHWYKTRIREEPENKKTTNMDGNRTKPTYRARTMISTYNTHKKTGTSNKQHSKNKPTMGDRRRTTAYEHTTKIGEKQKLIIPLDTKQIKLKKQILLLTIINAWGNIRKNKKNRQKALRKSKPVKKKTISKQRKIERCKKQFHIIYQLQQPHHQHQEKVNALGLYNLDPHGEIDRRQINYKWVQKGKNEMVRNLIEYNHGNMKWECQKCSKTTSQDVSNLIQHAIKKRTKIPEKPKHVITTSEQTHLINTRITTLLLKTNKIPGNTIYTKPDNQKNANNTTTHDDMGTNKNDTTNKREHMEMHD